MTSPDYERISPYSWVNAYMRCVFAPRQYGPYAYDCWGLVWHVCKYHAGIELPRFDDVEYQLQRINAEIQGQKLSDDWHRVDSPTEFDVVLMQRAGEAYHVGVFLEVDGGKVLHACPDGILCNNLVELHTMGFRQVTYWHYGNN